VVCVRACVCVCVGGGVIALFGEKKPPYKVKSRKSERGKHTTG
jgi:hypothetical protein